jgi:hypothetical protein
MSGDPWWHVLFIAKNVGRSGMFHHSRISQLGTLSLVPPESVLPPSLLPRDVSLFLFNLPPTPNIRM